MVQSSPRSTQLPWRVGTGLSPSALSTSTPPCNRRQSRPHSAGVNRDGAIEAQTSRLSGLEQWGWQEHGYARQGRPSLYERLRG